MATNTDPAPEQVGADLIMSEIRKSCFIIYVTFRRWHGQYKATEVVTSIGDQTVDNEDLTPGAWKMLPSDWHKRLVPFEGKVRKAVYACSMSFREGVYIVPKPMAKAMADDIRNIREDFLAVVEELCEAWPSILEQKRTAFDEKYGQGSFNRLDKKMPQSADEMRAQFGIEIGLWPTGSGLPLECAELVNTGVESLLQIRASCSNVAKFDAAMEPLFRAQQMALSAMGTSLKDDAEIWVNQAQRSANKFVGDVVNRMIYEPLNEFFEKVEDMCRMAENSTTRRASVEALQRAYSKLQSFSFLLPDEMRRRLEQHNGQIEDLDYRAVNAGGDGIIQLLTTLRQDLETDLNSVDALGVYTSSIQI